MSQDYELNDDIRTLHAVLVSEVNCPEILPYREDLVDDLMRMIDQAVASLKKKSKSIDTSAIDDEDVQDQIIDIGFRAHFHHMDVERIRYAITRYLRARIQKIEASIDYIHSDLNVLNRLSFQERQFADKLYRLNREHIDASLRLTGDLHAFVTGSAELVQHSTPNFDEFVICRINADVTLLVDDNNETTPDLIKAGSIKVLPYKHIRDEILQVDNNGNFLNEDKISIL